MIKSAILFLLTGVFASLSNLASGQQPSFRVLALYSVNVEADHALFAEQAVKFFAKAAAKDHFEFQSSTDWNDLNDRSLSQYQVILWLNGSPVTEVQRTNFQSYMEHGGAWLGFHAAGYNDASTRWPWYVDFLGGAVFYGNSWPPLPAKLVVDDRSHPVANRLPASFMSPANEWYIWKPDPRANKNVKVLLTLAPSNYPLGLKDTLIGGDLPVVWTNKKYKMIYMNMGHGDRIFEDATQNLLFENTLLWLGGRS
jgi:type 1 glutamine amidotransferase